MKPVTLPVEPHPHEALDYDALRKAGIKMLAGLADRQWTDFNAHDPGVTLLEAWCYALTDVGYRIFHDMPDLLAGGDPATDCLFTAREILTGQAVTPDDLRLPALDVPGVRNAWVTVDPKKGAVTLTIDPDVDTADGFNGAKIAGKVRERLHPHRAMGAGIPNVEVLKPVAVTVAAEIEIKPTADGPATLNDVFDKIRNCIAPPSVFHSLREEMLRKHTVDAVFEGPRRDHGFPDAAAPARKQTTSVNAADLIRDITRVEGVRAVRAIRLGSAGGAASEEWALPIKAGETPRLAVNDTNNVVKLFKGPLQVASGSAGAPSRTASTPRADSYDHPRPTGADRRLDAMFALKDDLPMAYGVRHGALSSSAPAARKAQANRLRAYLALFDQLIANQLGQLAHARRLLSADNTIDRSYGILPAPDLKPDAAGDPLVDKLFHRDLAELVEDDPMRAFARLNRFLDHLLARFGVELSDAAHDPASGWRVLEIKRQWLGDLPDLSGRRGCGLNLLDPDKPIPALQMIRMKLKLALPDTDKNLIDRIQLVEHNVRDPEPTWTVTVVVPDALRTAHAATVNRILYEVIPAHLTVDIQWMSDTDGQRFEANYKKWIDALIAVSGDAQSKTRTAKESTAKSAHTALLTCLSVRLPR